VTYDFVQPNAASTALFVAVVLFVVLIVFRAYTRALDAEHAARAPVRWAIGLGAWLAVGAALPASGVLGKTLPIGLPAFMPFMALSLIVATVLALSPVTSRIVRPPSGAAAQIALLVGFQAFRLPLELVLHWWFEQGTLPVQMAFAGYNFDIVTGTLALALGIYLAKGSPSATTRARVVLVFNIVGSLLLGAVVVIALLSSPVPFRTFHDDPPVLLVLYAPYAWILTVCVAGALWGHLVVWRWLRSNRC
jgi:hypothetical protein